MPTNSILTPIINEQKCRPTDDRALRGIGIAVSVSSSASAAHKIERSGSEVNSVDLPKEIMSSSSSSSSPPASSSSSSSSNPRGQQQPVIQTLLESFTRCFNPLNHYSGGGCTKIIDGGCGSSSDDDDNNNVVASTTTDQHTNSILKHRHGELPTSSSSCAAAASRAVSRSTSSTDANKKRQHHGDYDGDDAIHHRQQYHRNRKLSGEYLEERSMKRKLEIFRCDNGGATSRPPPPKLKPRQSNSHFNNNHHQAPSSSPRGRSSPHSSTSSDDEDLIRLTSQTSRRNNRRLFSCGVDLHDHDSPISNVARLFNMGSSSLAEAAQKSPFGLCFATPVRASSHEDATKLDEDALTAEEFMERQQQQQQQQKKKANQPIGLHANEITPDHHHHNNNNTTTDSSYNEEETITSTLYFDAKYSHLVQTRPPMPLFREDMLVRSSDDGDGGGCSSGQELSEMIKKRSTSMERRHDHDGEEYGGVVVEPPPPPFPTNVETVTHWRHRNPTPRQQNNSIRGLFLESSTTEEAKYSPMKKASYYANTGFISTKAVVSGGDGPSSPMRIRDESMSASTADSAEESYHV